MSTTVKQTPTSLLSFRHRSKGGVVDGKPYPIPSNFFSLPENGVNLVDPLSTFDYVFNSLRTTFRR